MAAPDPGLVLRVPGRLAVDPTDLTAAWPHGGTGLGLVREVVARPTRAYERIREEAFGQEVEDVLDLGEAWVLGAVLRGTDEDALAAVFAGGSAGATTGKRVVEYPGASRPGTVRTTRRLLFTPDDPDRHRWAIFYRAALLVDEAAELALQLDRELGIPLLAVATRDATNRIVAWGHKEDLTL